MTGQAMSTLSEALQIAIQHQQTGRPDLTEEICRRILAAEPHHADALHLLGVVAHQTGKYEDAKGYLEQAIHLKPTEAAFQNSLGEVYRALRRAPEAVACYRRALELKPDCAEAHYNLGIVFQAQGDLEQAVACYRRTLKLKPKSAEAYNNLGTALRDLGKPDEALVCYRRAVQLKPDSAEAYNNLGGALHDQGNPDEAVACCRRAVQLKPELAEAHYNLGNALKRQGKLDEALACCRRALALKPGWSTLHSTYLCGLRYHPAVTPIELKAACTEYERLYAAPLRTQWQDHKRGREPERPVVLGFVSPRFIHGPVGAFLARTLDCFDRRECRLVCYSDVTQPDDMTARFQHAAASWRSVVGITDRQLAEQIRADQIDILFDLIGHVPRTRLLAFARKPAPVQITWIDSVGTTGLAAIDYLLADRWLIPREAETYYSEKVLRMPNGYVCYDPPGEAPSVGPLPALARGHVTFGSFNQPAKMNRDVVQLWARILRRLPGARLVLKYRGQDSPEAVRYWQQMFAAEGVAGARLEFQGHAPLAEYLAEYGRIDISLDPFPHNGGATTCHSLWMGVPVVTCPGETFASRQSLSHLSNIGLTETIARDLDEYVEIAVGLAQDLPRLAKMRAELRERMAASPLCDGKRFAANLMALLRNVWRDWCQRAAAD